MIEIAEDITHDTGRKRSSEDFPYFKLDELKQLEKLFIKFNNLLPVLKLTCSMSVIIIPFFAPSSTTIKKVLIISFSVYCFSIIFFRCLSLFPFGN